MKSLIALFSAAAIMASITGFADTNKMDHKKPAKGAKPSKAKLVEVTTCPITGEAVKDMKAGGSEVVGNYNVHFCCAGCKPNFDKLSASDKLKKAVDASKKGSAAKKS